MAGYAYDVRSFVDVLDGQEVASNDVEVEDSSANASPSSKPKSLPSTASLAATSGAGG